MKCVHVVTTHTLEKIQENHHQRKRLEMPRRRLKPPVPEFEKVEVAGQYYSEQLTRLYRHNPQLISRIVEDLYVSMIYVNENFADAELERKQNELVQKEGR